MKKEHYEKLKNLEKGSKYEEEKYNEKIHENLQIKRESKEKFKLKESKLYREFEENERKEKKIIEEIKNKEKKLIDEKYTKKENDNENIIDKLKKDLDKFEKERYKKRDNIEKTKKEIIEKYNSVFRI